MIQWVTTLKAALQAVMVAGLLVSVASCDGDARPFEEQIEAGDLNLQSISIAPPANSLVPLYIGSGQGIQLAINGLTFDNEPLLISPENRRWTSSNESVLTVSEGGYVIGRSPGTAFVSVRVGGSVANEALLINVSDTPLQGIARIAGSGDNNGVLQQALDPCLAVSFSAIGNFGGEDERPLENVEWSIDAASLAVDAEVFRAPNSAPGSTLLVGRTPTSAGGVAAISLTATVLANEDEGTPAFTSTRQLDVDNSLTSFSVSPKEANVLTGRSVRLTAPVTYSTNNGVNFATNGVAWSVAQGSQAVRVGTVGDDPGVVTAITNGTATVVATCGAFSDSAIITVAGNSGNLVFNRNADIILTLADPDFEGLEVAQGNEFFQENAVTDEANWASSDTSIVTVDNDGSDRGDIRAVGVGEATITAEFEGARIGITVIVE